MLYEDCVTDFSCGPHLRNDYLIHYIIKGVGYYVLNDIRHEVKEGDIVEHIHAEYSIRELVDSCIKLLTDDSVIHRIRLRGYLHLIISNLEESFMRTEKTENTRSKSAEYIENAISYIEYNYTKAISVLYIASYIGLERTYFSKLFHNSLGMSPQDYLIKYRLEKAYHLIKAT